MVAEDKMNASCMNLLLTFYDVTMKATNPAQFFLFLFVNLYLFSCCLKGQTSMFVSGSKSVYIKSTTLSANGHITNNGTISGTTAGVLNLNGTSTQNINGTAVNTTTFGKININNSNGVSLGTNVDVTGTTGVDFLQGPLTLNASNIRFASGSTWANTNTSTKFFITNGLGLVSAQNAGAAVQYPVGVATGTTNYTPITITNAGISDSYGVRVQSGFRTNYNSSDGAPSGSLINTFVVNVSWIVNEGVAGNSALTTTLQWNSANETTGFDRTLSMVGYYRYALSNWAVSSIGGITNVGGAFAKTVSPALTSFSFLPISIGTASSPLPIELLDFSVKRVNNDAHLEWSTASETNNDHFEIERSLDGVTYKQIGTEKGAGNSTQVINYEMNDVNAGDFVLNGTIYYRLKQVDYDGKYSYSNIQNVFFSDEASTLIYPNPTQGNLTISYTAASEYEIMIRVIDILGAIVKEQKIQTDRGKHDLKLDLNELANGHYKIMLIAPSGVLTEKIVVSK